MQYVSNIEVLIEADSQDLCTLDQVKDFLNITTDTDDARLTDLIAFASGVISSICDRSFGAAQVEETVTVTGPSDGGGLVLSRYPVITIDSISRDGLLLGPSDYEIMDIFGGVLHGNFIGKNVITYTAGYDLPEDAPEPLSLACIDLIRSTYYLGSRDPSMQSITDNATGSIRFFPPPGMSRTGASTGKAGPLSPTAVALITPYRRLALA